jgi:hypothetical protein
VAVSAFAILVVGQAADIPAALAGIGGVDVRLLALPAIVVVAQMWLRSARWALLLSAAGGRRIGAWQALWPLTVGYLGNIALPARLGEVARIVLASRWLGISATGSTASVVIERAVDLLALITMATVAYGIVGTIGWLPFAATLMVLAGFALVLRAGTRLAGHVPRFLPAVMGDILRRLLVAFGAVQARVLAGAWGIGLATWAFDALLMFGCALALGIPVSPWLAVLLSAGAALGAALPAAAGALGTYELGAVAAAAALGVSPDAALQVALLAHLVAFAAIAGLGVVGGLVVVVRPSMAQVGGRPSSPADIA